MENYTSLIPFVTSVLLVSMTAAMFKPAEWYKSLRKPPWTPPNWLFAPVWTVLYIAIAVAGWLVWKKAGFGPALNVWTIQLLLNGSWSYVMFGAKNIGAAMLTLCALWLFVALFAYMAWPIDRVGSMLFWPYLAWVTIAGALNFSIWRLNRSA